MGSTTRASITHRSSRRGQPWPFKAQLEPAAVSDFGVGVPRRQEVEFTDGSRIWLLRVEQQGIPDLFLRDLGAPAAGMRIDLRRLVPEITEDLPPASTRDVPGIVHFTLRCAFGSVDELLQAAVKFGRPE